ncbi:unnamed protein product [Rotaria sp. Silwood2]|nr:unnamed protein product [Rotaria sp. Silwood2]CAF4669553.1 unnamed protein product [Rotaria sp. Silwood2]
MKLSAILGLIVSSPRGKKLIRAFPAIPNGWEWLAMDGNGWEWMGMDGNGWEWMGMDGNGWEWMGMVRMDGNG